MSCIQVKIYIKLLCNFIYILSSLGIDRIVYNPIAQTRINTLLCKLLQVKIYYLKTKKMNNILNIIFTNIIFSNNI